MNLIFGQGTRCKVWLKYFFKKRTYGKAYWIVTGTIYEMYAVANGLAKKPIKKKSYPYFRPSEKAWPHYSPALIGRRKPFESLVPNPCGGVTSASCSLATESPTFLTRNLLLTFCTYKVLKLSLEENPGISNRYPTNFPYNIKNSSQIKCACHLEYLKICSKVDKQP